MTSYGRSLGDVTETTHKPGAATELQTHALPPVEATSVRLSVVVIEGVDAGTTVTVEGPIYVGASDLCDLTLSDRTVSRRHLRLEPSPVGVLARDEQSRNGTWLGEARIREAELAVGQTLRVGSSVLRLEAELKPGAEQEAPAELPHVTSFGRFVGAATVLQPTYDQLRRAAASDVTVLIEGESGSGKELLAEALHERSERAEGPFVVVDCGSLPSTLVESELFGHERGAFSGASEQRAGAFEQAEGGTVFLDEIGELPLSMQTRLLRVLDRRQIKRVGSSQWISVNTRFLAATNRNLEREVEESRFRLDLFHRLSAVLIRVPPLRERLSDLELLVREIEASLPVEEPLDKEALQRMRSYNWPGNVREVRNYVERAHLLGDTANSASPWAVEKSKDTVPPSLREIAGAGLPFRQARAQILGLFIQAYTDSMLERHDGNVSAAARSAGVARRHFQRLKQVQ